MTTPIRQPMGPPLSSFTSSSSSGRTTPTSSQPGFKSPPAADQPADLRRNKTVSHTTGGTRWARSGSMSSTVKPVVPEEDGEVAVKQPDTWPENKGLVRQSSLPHRKGKMSMPAMTSPPLPDDQQPSESRPPRPPRSVQRETAQGQDDERALTATQGVTRAQSLRAQAGGMRMSNAPLSGGVTLGRSSSLRSAYPQHAAAALSDGASLGRSSSLRSAEPHYGNSVDLASPPHNPYGSPGQPSPPPLSSSAALPPSSIPYLSSEYDSGSPESHQAGSGIKRHQSLTHGYGANSRVRDRLERSPAVLTLEQRRLRDARRREDEPPTSPVGPSVWSSDQGERADDGWRQALPQRNLMEMMGSQRPLQDAFEAMSLRGHTSQPSGEGLPRQIPSKKLSLVTDEDILLQQPGSGHQQHRSLSAAPTVPAIGHGADTVSSQEPSWIANLVGTGAATNGGYMPTPDHALAQQAAAALSAIDAHSMSWADREALMAAARGAPWTGPPNMSFYQQQHQLPPGMMMHQPPNPYMYAQQQRGPKPVHHFGGQGPYHQPFAMPEIVADQQEEVIKLAKAKGLNPATFDCRPPYARFFVIKSFTEEDVHKSLKHEIWASTALGNQRLDRAFQESADKGPIYLFFSVNASGHFCGVAQMLTGVDHNVTSKVWAQDKWKGIFKVKWLFVRDVPNNALRHIKLLNTQEKRPITNSRDTQELLYDAGSEVLSIFLDFQDRAKTSLLQDFTYYEELEAARQSRTPNSQTPPPPSAPAATTHFNAAPPVPSIPLQYMAQPQAVFPQSRGGMFQPTGQFPGRSFTPPNRRSPAGARV